jgi:hypothetical protein
VSGGHAAFQEVQNTLGDNAFAVKVKPWSGVCCRRCWFAKTDKSRCRCRCNGVNHQVGRNAEQQIKEKQSSIKEFCEEPHPAETKSQ